MFSSTVTLDHFIQPVPIFEPTTDLDMILAIFQSKPDEVIAVVNEQGKLMGTISGSHLLQYLPQWLSYQLSGKERQLQQCLNECKNLLNPLITLPAQMSVGEFGLSLPESPTAPHHLQSYALVDQQEKFLGLLNGWKLLKFLFSGGESSIHQSQKNNESKLEQLLFEFLEQLPIPVLVSSQKGQVAYQNSSWHQQLGDYLPYDQVNPSFCPYFSLVPLSTKKATYPEKTVNLADIPESESVKGRVLTSVQLLSRQGQQEQSNHRVALEKSDLSARQPRNRAPELLSPTLSKSCSHLPWQFIKVPLSFKSLPSSVEPSWLVMALDITQHQRVCQDLALKNSELIQLNRLKDEFFTCISHELKSPLTSVIGLSSLLKEQKLGSLNERQVRYSELIYHSGRQLMMLVNDLLDLTRLETGQLKLKPIPLDVKTICQQAYQTFEERNKGKIDFPIPFTLEIDPGIEQIVADELRMQQMLFHLLDNAIKLSNSDGEIGLKVNRWENWLAFTVWDTGLGIPEDSQNLLFQQWQSQENPLSEQLEGTGLGLVLTQRLAKAHGGEISFISRKGRGSQFTLLLPISLTQQTLEDSRKTTITQIYPLVLVVESISTSIEQMTDLLTRLGYRVVIARTGTEALEKARQLQPATIFLNPLLPVLSGWDVLKLLKSDPATKQIKVIVTSFHCDQPHSEKVGADGFLSLPVEESNLQAILHKADPIVLPQLDHLTILRLHPDLEQSDWMGSVIDSQFDSCLGKQLSQLNCRLLEADSLEQAEMIASVWDINVVVLDGRSLEDPWNYLLGLSQCENLAALPLVTLDTEITSSANKIEKLSVFPCLLPYHENKIEQLLEVIQIAARTRLNIHH